MEYPVPNEVKQVVLGSILGDGHIRQKEYNGNPCNAHLVVTHSSQQKDYIDWKNELLGEYKGKVKHTSRDQYYFTSKSHKHLNPFYLLAGKPKKVTRKLLNHLDALGLAVWYQDDGTLGIEYYKREDGTEGIRRRRIALATDCFSLEEHWIMQQYFKVVWGIDTSIHKVRNKNKSKVSYRLTMNYENAKKFVAIVEPHIVPCMRYKIDFNRQRVCQNALPVTG
jgi:hypothetical protein